MTIYVAWMQASEGDDEPEYSAQRDRVGVISAVFSREGVLDPDAGEFAITERAAGSNFSIDIAPGRAAVRGDDVTDQGTYTVESTATENLTAPSPPGSGSRTHRVVLQVRDKLHNAGWSVYDAVPLILEDTGSGTPDEPDSAITLGFFDTYDGQSSVTDSDITNDPAMAAVGTLARTGSLTPNPGHDDNSSGRELEYQINPDGWVVVSGWLERTAGTFTAQGNTRYKVIINLPEEVTPPVVRDCVVMTNAGAVHLMVSPDDDPGQVYYRYHEDTQVVSGQWWLSLDGAGWRV